MKNTRIPGLLHDHIDGSAAVKTVIGDLYAMAGKKFPFESIEDWIRFFNDPQENIVEKFSTITSVLQTRESLELMGLTYGRFRAAEGYLYLEAKFAPSAHTFGGLSLKQAAEAMIVGLRKAESECHVRILPQLCINRGLSSAEEGLKIADLCLEYDGEVAMDLACDEANHPPEKHKPAFDRTYGTKVRRDCHAGEWVSPEPRGTYRARLLENVRTAVRVLRADGIGHALPLIDDPDLVREMVDKGIRAAGCPAAYVSAGLINDVRELGVPKLLDAGLRYTVNPDDDLFFPPVSQSLALLRESGEMEDRHWQKLRENVFLGAFAPGVRSWTVHRGKQ